VVACRTRYTTIINDSTTPSSSALLSSRPSTVNAWIATANVARMTAAKITDFTAVDTSNSACSIMHIATLDPGKPEAFKL
jgi:hypothetical protein